MSAPDRGSDQSFLRREAYADSTKLRDRGSIYAYRHPAGPIGPWVIGLVDWPEGVRALDAGCGPGSYLALLPPSASAIGVDLSLGMAREARVHGPCVQADLATLPTPSGVFDRVLAAHVLYHCPDIAAAAAELRRVLAPGGVLVAVTNAPDHLDELWALHADVTGERPPLASDRFHLGNGAELLRSAFADVRVEHFDGEVAVPDASALRAYVASMQHFTGVDSRDVLDELTARVQHVIEREGVYRARTRSGAFVCR